MTSTLLTRRQAAIVLASLPLAASAARNGLEIRYLIERDRKEPSGDIARRTFEGALLMASGETREADVRGEYRISVAMTEGADVAHVRISLWDNQRNKGDDFIGSASADVPVGGDTRLTLLSSANIHYPILLSATRRPLPDR